ncbi:MAG: malectin, partial [Paludibacter sp.]|nr:malectin [Paludibacter sp.]
QSLKFKVQSSKFNVQEKKSNKHYIYRLNCGGADYTDSYGNLWSGDVPKQDGNFFGSASWTDAWQYLPWNAASQGETRDLINGTADRQLFQTFRYGRDKLKYEFPLPDGEYQVELYFVETWWGRDKSMNCEGFRIFDVAISGETVLKNLDIWLEAGGANTALKKTVKGKAQNGILEISFPQTLAGQATVSAIAISSPNKNIKPAPSSAATRAVLPFPEERESVPAVIYKNFETTPDAKTFTFTITPGVASVYALRFKYQNTGKEGVKARIKIISANGQTMRDDEIDFPQTPAKWKILNTTTGTQINAGTYKVVINSNLSNLKFESLEVQ